VPCCSPVAVLAQGACSQHLEGCARLLQVVCMLITRLSRHAGGPNVRLPRWQAATACSACVRLDCFSTQLPEAASQGSASVYYAGCEELVSVSLSLWLVCDGGVPHPLRQRPGSSSWCLALLCISVFVVLLELLLL
jgi:hypothetical protein